jgi:hypothetical protein
MRQAERSGCPRQRLFFFFLSGLDETFGNWVICRLLSSTVRRQRRALFFQDFSDLEHQVPIRKPRSSTKRNSVYFT